MSRGASDSLYLPRACWPNWHPEVGEFFGRRSLVGVGSPTLLKNLPETIGDLPAIVSFGTIPIRGGFDDFCRVSNMHEWHTTRTDL